MSLKFPSERFATIQSSWLEPRKVRQMTFVGEKRMILYDDLELHEKIRVFDVRIERPAFYDTFDEFRYSYHYGDSYIPRLEQTEPLKRMCEHFLDCVGSGERPLSCGRKGLEVVRILEASSASLKDSGGSVQLDPDKGNSVVAGVGRRSLEAPSAEGLARIKAPMPAPEE